MRPLTYCAVALFAIVTFESVSHAAGVTQQQIDQCTRKVQASDDEAIAACTAAINAGRSRGADLAALYFGRATKYNAKGDNDRAIADYSQAIKLDPSNPAFYNDRGDAYYDNNDPEHAIADYSAAIRIDPKHTNAYLNRCWLYLNSNIANPDRAIADCSEAVRLDPQNARAYYYRGQGYLQKNDADHAIADYTEAIKLDADIDGSGPYWMRGKSLVFQGNFAAAIPDFTEWSKRDPKNADPYFWRGVANLYAGALPGALADMDQATTMAPKWAYGALWLDFIDKRSNLLSRMQQAVAQFDMTAWPAPILKFYLGELTPEAVEAAADDPDAATKTARLCEANYFIGEFKLSAGAKDEAAQRFRAAAAATLSCNSPYPAAAKAELKALGVSP